MKESINFNRAAAFYDATRKLRDDIADQITHALLAEIRAVGVLSQDIVDTENGSESPSG